MTLYDPPRVLVDAAYRTIAAHIAPDHTRHMAVLAWDCHGFYRDRSDELREAVLSRFDKEHEPVPGLDYLPEDEAPPPSSMLDDPIFLPDRQTADSIKRQIGGA